MNPLIETLNQFGGQLLQFAWPMLWQSSLLIAFVFALDFVLGRKIRASVRYALWLAVLVKLLLPPTLALPTGAAWWLFHAPTAVKAPAIRNYTVTYDPTPLANYVPSTIVLPPPAPPKLDGAGWALLAAGAISAGLFLWLMIRWWQVARMVRGATISEELAGLIEAVRRQAGWRSRIRLKLIEGRMSPAVCGLFRPVILLPRTLAEQLSPAQLRAVLLHEVFHLRRLDVWVNCAQALLQIVYWWHPLLWFANARIRRLREEAVDDAVMLALRDEADSYAPTLLEVAKLAFRRPLLSLGLVGIMESRSALRQRIERLVDFRAPRKAGLTFASLCGICVFSAVALPMGEGPAPAEKVSTPAVVPAVSVPKLANINTNLPQVLVTTRFYQVAAALKSSQDTGSILSTGFVPPAEFKQLRVKMKAEGYQEVSAPRVVTISGESASIYVGNRTNSFSFFCQPTVTNGLIKLSLEGQAVYALNGRQVTNQFKSHQTMVENFGAAMVSVVHPRNSGLTNLVVLASVEIVTNQTHVHQRLQTVIQRAGRTNIVGITDVLAGSNSKVDTQVQPAQVEKQWVMPRAKVSSPIANAYVTNKLTYTGPGRQSIISKLDRIRLDNVSFDSLPLNEVLRFLAKQSQLRDPDHEGINFLINSNPDKSGQTMVAPAGSGAQPIDPATGLLVATNAVPVEDLAALPITLTLTNVTLADVLDAIVVVCHPVKYSIRDFAVVFSVKVPETPQLFSRVFKVDANVFYSGLKNFNIHILNSVQSNGNPYAIDIGDGGLAGGRYITKINPASDVSVAARKFFTALGVNLESPPGKSVFYNDRLGKLFVKATESDLDKIERALSALGRVNTNA